jgi:type IV conjugative transfer system protein TraL
VKSLDNPARILSWDLDEVCVVALPFFLGVCTGSLVVSLLGVPGRYFYIKFKKKFPKNSLKHRFYWIFPTATLVKMGVFKNLPLSHIRDYIL